MIQLLDNIISDPSVCNGKPTFKGTRIGVTTILEFLAAEDSEKEVLENYPVLTKKDIQTALRFASKLMNNHYSIKNVA
ncbi:DUF433 domain-containing protein [Psychroserpens sp.]|uniref:DUF433 domain-containing protein n=1 Tax=Psychroserpens sp. TaxID=2020870 RepID=UPI00385EBC74